MKNQTQVENYYINNFNNLKYIKSLVSKWAVFEQVKEIIELRTQSKFNMARALIKNEPVVVKDMNLVRKQILSYLNKNDNYCPVSYQISVLIMLLDRKNSFRAP